MNKNYMKKNHSSVNRQHTFCQNAACSNEFFLRWVDYALEENVLAEQM